MKKTFLLIIITAGLFSFSDKNKPAKGFDLKELEHSLAVIPMGTFDMDPFGGIGDRKTMSYTAPPPIKPVTVEQFSISKYEISNGQYLDFLSELKKTDTLQYRKMLPDTLVWRQKFSYNEPYVEYYLRHPAYRDYPVVGLTHEQAEYFCSWLTEKYNKEPGSKFKNVRFRLPTVEQWVLAALGKASVACFPWGDDFNMQDKNGKWRANFMPLAQGGIRRDSVDDNNWTKQGYGAKYYTKEGQAEGYVYDDITAPVKSYEPNGYGLYNMAGNVEEYIREKGITKGGSWRDTGYYLQNFVAEKYDTLTQATASDRGFRIVMETIK